MSLFILSPSSLVIRKRQFSRQFLSFSPHLFPSPSLISTTSIDTSMYAKFEKWIVLSFRVINRGSDSDSSVRKYADESRRKWKCVYECARVAFAESTNERKDRWCSLVQRNCIEITRVIKYSRIRAVVVRGRGGADERRKHESSTRVWSLCTGGCHTIRRLEPSSCIVRLDTNDYNSRQLKRLVCGIYFQCSAREHWMVIKKSFFFFLFSFYAVRIGREPSAHVTVYSSRSLRIYIHTYTKYTKLSSGFLHPDDIWNLC